jgi:diguanylate cyclase
MIGAINKMIRKKADRHFGGHVAFLVWMSALVLVAGLIQLGEPLEDLMGELRNKARAKNASGDIVFVGIDPDTKNALPTIVTDRSHDAKIVEQLFAAGATRVYFNDTHTRAGSSIGDTRFATVLKEHEGRVFIGHMNKPDGFDASKGLFINQKSRFDTGKNTVALTVYFKPFFLSRDIPFNSQSNQKMTKSLAYHMVGSDNYPNDLGKFRPDFSILATSIPTYSYRDVHDGRNIAGIKGKVAVIGSSDVLDNKNYLPSQGYVNATKTHIIAAETLKNGRPIDIGWAPFYVVGCIIGAFLLFVRSNRIFAMSSVGAIGLYLLLPLSLDARLIQADYMPGMVLVIAVSIRSFITRNGEKSAQTNRVTGIKNFTALRDGHSHRAETLIAIKVRNFAAIAGRFDRIVEADVYREIRRRLSLLISNPEIYQFGDTLVWMTKMPPNTELLDSLSGVNSLTSAGNFLIDDIPVEVSLAFGIDGDHSRTIDQRLIDALANAENAARSNRLYSVASEVSRHDESRNLDLLASFDRALANGEIWAAYQPKYDGKTGDFQSAEALARWSNDRFGTISAAEFIALAEANNRIKELTHAMLDHAMDTLKMAQSIAPGFRISVNVSPRLLTTHEFEAVVLEKLRHYQLSPNLLMLEIVETEKLDLDKAEPILRSLAAMGIALSVDDYGTGQATLDYLRTDTFKEIKIDRKFVSKMDVSKSDFEMVQATVQMAHSLGKTVVAEGIEHAHIGRMLTDMGCDELQGFHYAMPMACDDLLRLIGGRHSEQKRTGNA